MRVAILCLLLLVAGCTAFQQNSGESNKNAGKTKTVYDHDGSKAPSTAWDEIAAMGSFTSKDERKIRNIQGQNGIRYVDDKFYSHYEGLTSKPQEKNIRERFFQILQWAGTAATAYFSWRAGQSDNEDANAMTQDGKKKPTNYNDRISKLGIGTAAITGLNAILDKWDDSKKDKPIDTLSLERNRRDIRDCITSGLANKPMNDYSIENVKDDLDAYYRAGGLTTIGASHIWFLHCSRP